MLSLAFSTCWKNVMQYVIILPLKKLFFFKGPAMWKSDQSQENRSHYMKIYLHKGGFRLGGLDMYPPVFSVKKLFEKKENHWSMIGSAPFFVSQCVLQFFKFCTYPWYKLCLHFSQRGTIFYQEKDFYSWYY